MANSAKRRHIVATTAALTMLATLTIAAIFIAAQGVLRSNEDAHDQQTPPPVTVTVRTGQVSQLVNAPLTRRPAFTITVLASGTVTADGAPSNASLSEGALVGIVDNLPVMVVQGTLPSYRELRLGAVGADVAQLRAALGRLGHRVGQGDTLDLPTARAILAAYTKLGTPLRDTLGKPLNQTDAGQLSLRSNQLVFAPSLPVSPLTRCGTMAAKVSGPLCMLASAKSKAIAAVPLVDADKVKGGAAVRLRTSSGASLKGTVTTRLDADPTAQSDKAPTVSFEIAHSADGAVDFTDAEIVIAEGKPGSLIVEGNAISEATDDEGYLTKVDGTRVNVRLGLCASGLCEVSGEVVAGAEVRLR